jgi:hypothetical protein
MVHWEEERDRRGLFYIVSNKLMVCSANVRLEGSCFIVSPVETAGERLMTEEYWTVTKNLTAMSWDNCMEYS